MRQRKNKLENIKANIKANTNNKQDHKRTLLINIEVPLHFALCSLFSSFLLQRALYIIFRFQKAIAAKRADVGAHSREKAGSRRVTGREGGRPKSQGTTRTCVSRPSVLFRPYNSPTPKVRAFVSL